MSNYERTIRHKRAKGTLSEDGTAKSIAVAFDLMTFNRIADEAVKNEISFGEQVRLYVGLGIERARKVA